MSTRTHAGSGPGWLLAAGIRLDLSRPRVMAILNITPDSFSDGGGYLNPDAALAHAQQAIAAGADILDIGGESTRPGATRIPADQQIARVLPVIAVIRRSAGSLGSIPISIDTTLSAVAEAALEAGVNAVNDVSAGREDAAMFDTVRRHRAGVVLMHRLAPPDRDSYSDRYSVPPSYDDVGSEVGAFLRSRAAAAEAAGIPPEAIVLDPGLGFGKSVAQNLELIARTGEIADIGYPVLSGLSRKSFVGRAGGLADSTPSERLPATLALSVTHLLRGARVFRVHDVREHAQALAAAHSALAAGREGGGTPGGNAPAPHIPL
jgi:dihydropteroate synthase